MNQVPLPVTLLCDEPQWHGERIDKFLIAHIPNFSRNYFQELILAGCVTLNGTRVTKVSSTIRLNDSVTITFKSKQCNFDPADVAFDVIDEQPDFLVINKPAGLLVHHTATKPEEVTLINGLLFRYPEMKDLDSMDRPGIVHRIDKNTSGILIIARNQQAQQHFSQMFHDRQIHKTYLAVVRGTPANQGTIDLPIGRHPIDRHKMATFGVETRQALTHYKVIEQFKTAAILEVNIITGRTHQVRVHCASMGHGLLGDDTYGITSPLINRHALHAWKVSFNYLGKDFSYQAPLPDDLTQLIDALKSGTPKT